MKKFLLLSLLHFPPLYSLKVSIIQPTKRVLQMLCVIEKGAIANVEPLMIVTYLSQIIMKGLIIQQAI